MKKLYNMYDKYKINIDPDNASADEVLIMLEKLWSEILFSHSGDAVCCLDCLGKQSRAVLQAPYRCQTLPMSALSFWVYFQERKLHSFSLFLSLSHHIHAM